MLKTKNNKYSLSGFRLTELKQHIRLKWMRDLKKGESNWKNLVSLIRKNEYLLCVCVCMSECSRGSKSINLQFHRIVYFIRFCFKKKKIRIIFSLNTRAIWLISYFFSSFKIVYLLNFVFRISIITKRFFLFFFMY